MIPDGPGWFAQGMAAVASGGEPRWMEFDAEKFATLFGLPGLILVLWYLLETQKNKRLEREFDAKGKFKERELAIEEAKVVAMTVGFQALATGVAGLDGKLDAVLDSHARSTPAHGLSPVTGRRNGGGT